MTMNKLVEWQHIADEADWNTLVLGNGASMAVCPGFGYEPLLQAAKKWDLISDEVEEVFRELKTTDFELVLRALRQTQRINGILGVQGDRSSKAYSNIRDALVRTVRRAHPQHEDVSSHLDNIGGFLKQFDTVLSLIYDLIVYWAVMEWSDKEPRRLKDCFIKDGKFPDN